jgi:hypothetical protein
MLSQQKHRHCLCHCIVEWIRHCVCCQSVGFVRQVIIRLLSAFTYDTLTAHCLVGYIPTKHVFERGGYETHTANWPKFDPEALDVIVDEIVSLIKEIFS